MNVWILGVSIQFFYEYKCGYGVLGGCLEVVFWRVVGGVTLKFLVFAWHVGHVSNLHVGFAIGPKMIARMESKNARVGSRSVLASWWLLWA